MNVHKKINSQEDYRRLKKIYYVCSYTGCGTMLLTTALENEETLVRICHSRFPPDKLEFVFSDGLPEIPKKRKDYNKTMFKFNGTKVPDDLLDKITVIYIFKNPVNSIYSRLRNNFYAGFIESPHGQCELTDIIDQKKDLFELEQFFDNYTKPNPNRNYPIICVNYHKLFEEQDKLTEYLGIPPLGLVKKENKHEMKDLETLEEIYKPLNDKIKNMPFMTIS